jgi:tetratricopeptide (TPR) repeat protein
MDLLEPIFTKTVSDPELYLGDVYLDVAEFCRRQLDSQHRFIPSYLGKAIYLYQNYLKVTGDSSASILQAMGSTFFRLKRYDEAERYYILVKIREPQNYTNYFNLVEVQLMEKKLVQSQETLQDCYKQFIVNRRYDFDSTLHLGLYYFYLSEIQTLRHLPSHESLKVLRKVISDNQKTGKLVFTDWSFRTFYYWVLEEPTITAEVRKKLLTNICIVIHESDLSTDINCSMSQ